VCWAITLSVLLRRYHRHCFCLLLGHSNIVLTGTVPDKAGQKRQKAFESRGLSSDKCYFMFTVCHQNAIQAQQCLCDGN
jgi:hypothetical protein